MITSKATSKQLRNMARQFNLSRPRGVSFNHPSPQLSRDKLGAMRVIARMNILYRIANAANKTGDNSYAAKMVRKSIALYEASK